MDDKIEYVPRKNVLSILCGQCESSDEMRVGYDLDTDEVLVLCTRCQVITEVIKASAMPDGLERHLSHGGH